MHCMSFHSLNLILLLVTHQSLTVSIRTVITTSHLYSDSSNLSIKAVQGLNDLNSFIILTSSIQWKLDFSIGAVSIVSAFAINGVNGKNDCPSLFDKAGQKQNVLAEHMVVLA